MYPPECDKKDLLHAIGATFGGVIKSEIKGDFCRLKVQFDAQKLLRRGLFILTSNQEKVWISFKYENLPNFCSGCGRMGHDVKECTEILIEDRNKSKDELPYSLALK